MRTAGPKRPKHNLTRDIPVEEFANALFDILAGDPKAVQRMKDIAAASGTTFEVLVHETIGLAYHVQGKPVPPKLREYLAKHDPNMPDTIRQKLLKLGLN